ncbi:hypothetical protein MNEG_14709, partial [Monoraphidium neglectum]
MARGVPAPCVAHPRATIHAGRRNVLARVSSIPSRPTADDGQFDAADLGLGDAASPSQTPQQQQDARIVQQLQLNVAHYVVDGASLPADHPDHEEPRGALQLIPADHPEAPLAQGDEIAAAAAGDAAVAVNVQLQPLLEEQQQEQQEQQQHEQQQEAEQQQQQQQQRTSNQRQHQPRAQQQRQQRAKSPPQQQHQTPAWQLHPRFGERVEAAFAVGDTVMGEVVHNGGSGGARVRLLDHEGVIG